MKSLGATEVVDYSVEEVWGAVADNSVDVVYNNYNGKGNADMAMRKLKPGGFYIAIIGPLSSRPKPGVVQKSFLVNATRPRDLVSRHLGHSSQRMQQLTAATHRR